MGIALPGSACYSRASGDSTGGRESTKPYVIRSLLYRHVMFAQFIEALIGFQGRGLDDVVQPDSCHGRFLIHASANLASFLLGKHPQSLGLHALHRIWYEKWQVSWPTKSR